MILLTVSAFIAGLAIPEPIIADFFFLAIAPGDLGLLIEAGDLGLSIEFIDFDGLFMDESWLGIMG